VAASCTFLRGVWCRDLKHNLTGILDCALGRFGHILRSQILEHINLGGWLVDQFPTGLMTEIFSDISYFFMSPGNFLFGPISTLGTFFLFG